MSFKLKEYFSSTSSERKGLFVLTVLLALSFFYFFIEDYFLKTASPVEISVKEVGRIERLSNQEKDYKAQLKKEKVTLFQFNPNEATQEEWEQLGFSTKQAASIVKYRSKGFRFKKKTDLKKLYVIDEEKYQQLEPYIVLPAQKPKKKQENYRIVYLISPQPVYQKLTPLGQVYYKKEQDEYKYYSEAYPNWEMAYIALENVTSKGFESAFITKLPVDFRCYPIVHQKEKSKKIEVIIEVNSADTTAFKRMKGIGSYYAKKLVNYREKLGGFYSVEQLKEVYGIQPEVIEQNKDRLTLDTTLIDKININTVTKEELKRHPYIKWNIANSLVMYRINHGKYQSVQNIQNSDLVNDELYRKIVRYLTVK
ncbi:MAG: helix-hairpin-helix domain-containing protein [Flavobacteriales bacterium]|jgi:competence ComEA-like helix-hairpin-helix protein|nr:helix-hairpin-helix domain-containing protein [Flavobacteriales bacterium]